MEPCPTQPLGVQNPVATPATNSPGPGAEWGGLFSAVRLLRESGERTWWRRLPQRPVPDARILPPSCVRLAPHLPGPRRGWQPAQSAPHHPTRFSGGPPRSRTARWRRAAFVGSKKGAPARSVTAGRGHPASVVGLVGLALGPSGAPRGCRPCWGPARSPPQGTGPA